MKSKLSIILIIIGIIVLLFSFYLTFNNNKINNKKDEEEQKVDASIYKIERILFYKENNGKLVEIEEGEEKFGYIDLSISNSDYIQEKNEDNYDWKLTFNHKSNKYKLEISLDNGKYMTYKDIEDYYKSKYSFIDINSDYKVNDTKVLKQEYSITDYKYLDYIYLYKNGFYIKYTFIASQDYNFNYDEIEKILSFNVKERLL